MQIKTGEKIWNLLVSKNVSRRMDFQKRSSICSRRQLPFKKRFDRLDVQRAIRDPIDTVQYKFIIIPKYMDGKGAVILKAHHNLADGLGFSFLFLAISDVWDKSALPALKPMGCLKSTLVYSLLPFLVLKAGL